MDIHHLKIFTTVYKLKSFSRASEHLNISQPTISEHIKNLEQELSTRLFDRLPRTIIPTDDAHLMYPRCLHILEELAKLKEEVTQKEKSLHGTIRIGASTIPGTYILPEQASVIKKSHPDLLFEIIMDDSRNIIKKVLDHEILLGVVGAVMESDKLDFQSFIEDELVCVAPKKMKIKNILSLKELTKFPFLIREEGSGSRNVMEDYLKKNELEVNDLSIHAVLGSSSAIREAVKAGLGLSIISSRAVQEDIANSTLKKIRIKGIRIERKFYVVTHPKRTLPRPYALVKHHLLKSTPRKNRKSSL